MYPTIYCCSNFGTWNCWNANLGNGLYICCIILYMNIEILELGTVGTQNLSNGFLYGVILPYIDAQIFGTWNFWNANLSNGLYICCIILYMHIEILELGTVGTQI